MSTIRTDSIAHAVSDLSDARILGADLNDPAYACVEIDGGERVRCVEVEPGQWSAWLDDADVAYPL